LDGLSGIAIPDLKCVITAAHGLLGLMDARCSSSGVVNTARYTLLPPGKCKVRAQYPVVYYARDFTSGGTDLAILLQKPAADIDAFVTGDLMSVISKHCVMPPADKLAPMLINDLKGAAVSGWGKYQPDRTPKSFTINDVGFPGLSGSPCTTWKAGSDVEELVGLYTARQVPSKTQKSRMSKFQFAQQYTMSMLSPFSVADLCDTNRRHEAIKRVYASLREPPHLIDGAGVVDLEALFRMLPLSIGDQHKSDDTHVHFSSEDLLDSVNCDSPRASLARSAQHPGKPSKRGDPKKKVPQSFAQSAGIPRGQNRKREVAADRTVTSLLRTIMTRITGIDTRITDMGAQLNTRITGLDTRITGLDTRITDMGAQLNTRIARMDDKLDVLSENFDQHLHRRGTVLPLLPVLPVTSFVRAHPFGVVSECKPSRVHAFDCE
jgi:hypothetical protein